MASSESAVLPRFQLFRSQNPITRWKSICGIGSAGRVGSGRANPAGPGIVTTAAQKLLMSVVVYSLAFRALYLKCSFPECDDPKTSSSLGHELRGPGL